MIKPVRTMLFDLDGTIVDTNELIIRSFLEALKGIAPEGFSREHIIPSMGLTLSDQMKIFSGLEQVDHLIAAYREVNYRLHNELVKPFAYVGEVMDHLQKQGVRIGIVTTKMRLSTEKSLKFVGLYDYIVPDAIVTIDDVKNAKPHPEPVLMALDKLGAAPEDAIMVGDSPVDMQSANAAGVVSVGVAWSLKGAEKLRESGAKHVIDDMRELYAFAGLEREKLAGR
ncbi:HAD-IA family hydrolase [Paenibacillus radicis (ex Gao et al. 2016)]|uniref:Pyrophosphatase PpaX n=1 Tax=Paenibacillus radicis (ex Gao et al. 2016) TaxID=1737354 RepID=A0A917H4L5_9BACL|nr:HAD-IA family hydrolase [Paenibacillus radicis (ex Gao et al. 2016)]GGG67791.1 pyrophosphatase PpaX [Paenibacillus radicis (ex Gao et al. 2016)]